MHPVLCQAVRLTVKMEVGYLDPSVTPQNELFWASYRMKQRAFIAGDILGQRYNPADITGLRGL